MRPERWEYGSDFHSPDSRWLCGSAPSPWDAHPVARLRTGRHALVAVARRLQEDGTKRLWVPSYFCQEVLAPIAAVLPLVAYADRPDAAAPDVSGLAYRPGDALLAFAPFGLRQPAYGAPESVVVVEDHTHDPFSAWARASTAHHAVASLRKSLPVPDGAVWWSPRALRVDRVATADTSPAPFDRLSGMALKAAYLEGASVDKSAFRALLVAGEAAIASGDGAPMSAYTTAVLTALDGDAWRATRRANFETFRSALDGVGGVRVWTPSAPDPAPFAAVVTLDDPARRDAVRAALIDANVYPAILWALDAPVVRDIPDAHVTLARASLALPVDARYDRRDVERAAGIVREAIESTA